MLQVRVRHGQRSPGLIVRDKVTRSIDGGESEVAVRSVATGDFAVRFPVFERLSCERIAIGPRKVACPLLVADGIAVQCVVVSN